jgi:hypothetical protein
MKNFLSALLAAAGLLVLPGCEQDEVIPPVVPPPAPVDATLGMWFNVVNDTLPFLPFLSVLQDSLGHPVQMTAVRFYVSDVKALDDEGNLLAHYDGQHYLVDAADQDSIFLLGAIHANHVHELRFNIGVESTANHVDPSLSSPPLNDASMWLDAAQGHRFLSAKGFTDVNNDGFYETNVNYGCGTDALLTEAHAFVHHDLQAAEYFSAYVRVDVSQLFRGINVATDNSPGPNAPTSVRMMQNLAGAISGPL